VETKKKKEKLTQKNSQKHKVKENKHMPISMK
jgi:hypothetical protein